MTTLDGFFEGPNRELDWHNVDPEFNEFAARQLDEAGMLFFGRVTYELMAGYWPTAAAQKNDPVIARKMNDLPKIAFSRTSFKPQWKNATVSTEVDPTKIKELKRQSGKDIAIFGSSNLCVSFIQAGLVDEFRIMVNPVVLGKGHALFAGLQEKLDLKLIRARPFESGNVLLSYHKAE